MWCVSPGIVEVNSGVRACLMAGQGSASRLKNSMTVHRLCRPSAHARDFKFPKRSPIALYVRRLLRLLHTRYIPASVTHRCREVGLLQMYGLCFCTVADISRAVRRSPSTR